MWQTCDNCSSSSTYLSSKRRLKNLKQLHCFLINKFSQNVLTRCSLIWFIAMQINSHLHVYLSRILKSLFFRKKSTNSKIVRIENHLFAVEEIFSHSCRLVKWVLREESCEKNHKWTSLFVLFFVFLTTIFNRIIIICTKLSLYQNILFSFVLTRRAVREIFSHRRTITRSVSREVSQVNTKTEAYIEAKDKTTIIIKCVSRQNQKWTFSLSFVIFSRKSSTASLTKI